ncbi:MAG: hypothetical protein QOF59_2848 [Actinomycetota bacterium]|nr:hypothetical protein [Actinomycetota bacterium]
MARPTCNRQSGRVRSGARFERWDSLVVAALLIAAYLARRNVLPHGGLLPDDAWQAFGAAKGSPGNLLTVGFSSPGFTGALMVWSRITGPPERMANLAFAAGVVTPAVIYAALRRFGYVPSISLLLGAALVSEKLNIVYSGRVKSYVIDALIVLGFAAVLPRVVRMRFTWRVAALWIVGSFAVGFFSPFALVAAGVAGIALLLRPAADLPMRTAAVVGQGAASVALTLAVRRTYDVNALELWWKRNYDGFVGFDAQPLRLVSHVATHLRRVAAVFSGGPSWWAALTLIVVVIALGVDAWVRRRSARGVRAQYLLLLMLAAVVVSVAGVLPLGPTSIGMRLSLWLVPLFAIGAASAVDQLRTRLAGHDVARLALDGGAVIVAAVLIVTAAVARPYHPAGDVRSAAPYVERKLTANDVVFIEHTECMFSYALESHVRIGVRPRRGLVAFEPDIRDPRFYYVAFTGKLADTLFVSPASAVDYGTDVTRAVGHADRVYLHLNAAPRAQLRGRIAFANLLRGLGYRQESDTAFGCARVVVWKRSAA